MKKVILPLLTIAAVFVSTYCRSADDAADTQARKIAGDFFRAYSKTFATGDAKAVAANWKADAEIVDPEGLRIIGRDAIEKTYAEFFKEHPGSKTTIELLSAKPEGEGVIVAEIVPKIDPPITKAFSKMGAVAVLVKEKDGKWLIEGVREKPPVPASYEHLKQLQWLVGDWAVNPKKAKNVSFSMHCHWTENKSFLICMYTVKHLDVIRHGTEVIGWDAKEKKIRSWTFSSSGGFSQAFWQLDGKRWTIDNGGESAEGEAIKATQIITAVDADTFTFESKNRTKGGEKEDDLPLLEMQRVKSQLPPEKSGE
jgi:uncharacterized protein (TIGR02246 family)